MPFTNTPYGHQALSLRKDEALQPYQISDQLADKFWTFAAPFSLDDAKALVDEVFTIHPSKGELDAEMVVDIRDTMAGMSHALNFTHDCLGFFLHEISWRLSLGFDGYSKDVTEIKQNLCLAAEVLQEFISHTTAKHAFPKHHAKFRSDLAKFYDAMLTMEGLFGDKLVEWHESDAKPLFEPQVPEGCIEEDDVTEAERNMMLSSSVPAQKANGYVSEIDGQIQAFKINLWELMCSCASFDEICDQTA